MAKALVLVALLSGCSFAFQKTPHSHPTACSTSHVYWIVDSVTTGALLATATGAYATSTDTEHVDAGYTVAGAALMASLFYFASARHGYEQRGACADRSPVTTAAR